MATDQLSSVNKDITAILQGLDKEISPTIFFVIIVTFGGCVITIALYMNYWPCKIEAEFVLSAEEKWKASLHDNKQKGATHIIVK